MRGCAILFDLDGTLADSRQAIIAGVAATLDALGIEADPTLNLSFVLGPAVEDWMPNLLRHYADDRARDAIALFRAHQLMNGSDGIPLFEGIGVVLQDLSNAGYGLHVATSKRMDIAVSLLEKLGIAGRFDSVGAAMEDGRFSDKASLIKEVLRRERLSAYDTVMIGDRRFDIEGARANDVRSIGAAWGYGMDQELSHAGATMIASAPSEILPLIGRLFSPQI